jgi:hypothetical protein
MTIQTVNSTHQALKDALENLKKHEIVMENGKREREWSMLDIYNARILQAEKEVVDAAGAFVHYLSEACIKF